MDAMWEYDITPVIKDGHWDMEDFHAMSGRGYRLIAVDDRVAYWERNVNSIHAKLERASQESGPENPAGEDEKPVSKNRSEAVE